MNQKYFKYERRNHKKIRIKDLLMILSIFTLCIITVAIAGASVNKKNKINVSKNITNKSKEVSVIEENNDEHIVPPTKISSEVENNNVNVQADTQIYNPDFDKPVNGVIIKPFSPDNLIYSETMDDWRTHMGIDISCPLNTQVVSSEKGIVKKVLCDVNYGYQVTVETGDYEHIYSSLSSDVLVAEGQSINKGDPIGNSSDSCISEICDEPHIHFEIKKNGIHINPTDLIEFN